jgi:hypothetical protein
MIKVGKKLYNLNGDEVFIESISGNTLNTIVTRYSFISYNNGSKSEVQTFKDRKTFSVNDIVMLLFSKKEDISEETAVLCKNSLYKFNAESIQKSRDAKFKKIQSDIKLDEPLQIMIPDARKAIISSYYSDEVSMQEKEAFYRSESSEYFGRIDLDTEFY